jgi:hypothetical protein
MDSAPDSGRHRRKRFRCGKIKTEPDVTTVSYKQSNHKVKVEVVTLSSDEDEDDVKPDIKPKPQSELSSLQSAVAAQQSALEGVTNDPCANPEDKLEAMKIFNETLKNIARLKRGNK